MIEAKEAVSKAREAARSYYSDSEVVETTLEEIDRTDDGTLWLITLTIHLTNPAHAHATGLSALATPQIVQKLKVFEVDAETGQVVSMKMRSSDE